MSNHEKRFLFVMGSLAAVLIAASGIASAVTSDWTPVIGMGIACGISLLTISLVCGLDKIAEKIWKEDK